MGALCPDYNSSVASLILFYQWETLPLIIRVTWWMAEAFFLTPIPRLDLWGIVRSWDTTCSFRRDAKNTTCVRGENKQLYGSFIQGLRWTGRERDRERERAAEIGWAGIAGHSQLKDGVRESGCVLVFRVDCEVCESLDIYSAHCTQHFCLRAGTRQVTSYSAVCHFILCCCRTERSRVMQSAHGFPSQSKH